MRFLGGSRDSYGGVRESHGGARESHGGARPSQGGARGGARFSHGGARGDARQSHGGFRRDSRSSSPLRQNSISDELLISQPQPQVFEPPKNKNSPVKDGVSFADVARLSPSP